LDDNILLPPTFHKQWQESLKYTGMNSATCAHGGGGGGCGSSGSGGGGSKSGGDYDDPIITVTNMIPFGI
jgi:hypothetical protein